MVLVASSVLLMRFVGCVVDCFGFQCASSAAITSSGGSISCRRTSFLPSQRVSALRSAASVAGRANGFNISRVPRIASSCEAGFLNVRSDATLAGKETLLEQAEFQTEVL